MRGAEGWTDHRLVWSQFTLTIQKPSHQKRNKSVRRLNTASLKQEETRVQLEEAITNELDQPVPDFNDIEKDWRFATSLQTQLKSPWLCGQKKSGLVR